jgi:tricorn protease-like protein
MVSGRSSKEAGGQIAGFDWSPDARWIAYSFA